MKRILLILLTVGLLIATAYVANAQTGYGQQGYYHYGPYMMGPGMMGGYGMGPGYGTGPNQRGWQEMTPKQREEWQSMRYKYYKDTLQLRQKIANKQMELHALWNSPQPDQAKIKALSNEITDLRAQLAKERDHYLMECRQKFGDLGWSCPAMGGGGY